MDIDKFRHNELYWLLRDLLKRVAELEQQIASLPKPRKRKTNGS